MNEADSVFVDVTNAALPGAPAPEGPSRAAGGSIMDPVADGIEVAPFTRAGLRARLLPFVVVSVVAMVSVLLPSGGLASWHHMGVAAVLLTVVVLAAFAVPWARLPVWVAVAIPLLYAASMLELVLSSGTASGVGTVLLLPLVWSVLFHHRWESVCVLVTIVLAEVIISVVQSAPPTTLARRVVLWTALGAVILLAAHGLRERIRRAHEHTTALQNQLHQMTDRDRIAARLTDTVIRQLFAAGLDLHGAASCVTDEAARRRLLNGVAELDRAIAQLRITVYDLRPDDSRSQSAGEPSSTTAGDQLSPRRSGPT
ncbi:histidine kinase [Streptomyces sp. NPDC048484]|uniref:histidine kinase n=1 Tax=Streptomyces sp. NPDC048484 TaxID=3155146 RepID=UPI003435BF16